MKIKSTLIASVAMLIATTSALALVAKPEHAMKSDASTEALVQQLEASLPRATTLAPPL
jgi:hypothetical protein